MCPVCSAFRDELKVGPGTVSALGISAGPPLPPDLRISGLDPSFVLNPELTFASCLEFCSYDVDAFMKGAVNPCLSDFTSKSC